MHLGGDLIILLLRCHQFHYVYRCHPQYKANAKAVDHEGRTCLQHVRAACRSAAGAASVQDVGPLTDLLVQNGCPENGTSTLTRPLDILPSSVIWWSTRHIAGGTPVIAYYYCVSAEETEETTVRLACAQNDKIMINE